MRNHLSPRSVRAARGAEHDRNHAGGDQEGEPARHRAAPTCSASQMRPWVRRFSAPDPGHRETASAEAAPVDVGPSGWLAALGAPGPEIAVAGITSPRSIASMRSGDSG